MSNYNFELFNEYEKIFSLALKNKDFYTDLMAAIDDVSSDPNSDKLKNLVDLHEDELGIGPNRSQTLQLYLHSKANQAPQFKIAIEAFKVDIQSFEGAFLNIQAC